MTVAAQVKQTLAGLKNADAVLRIYAEQTREEETAKVFREAYLETGEIIKQIEARLKTIELEEPQYKGF